MKFSLLVITSIISFQALAVDSDKAKEQWKEYNSELDKILVQMKNVPGYRSVVPTQESCSLLGCKIVCVDSTGEEIQKEKCENLNDLLKTLQPVSDLSKHLKSEGCLGILTGSKQEECQSLVQKQKAHNLAMQHKIKDHEALPSNTAEETVKKYEVKIAGNLEFISNYESKTLNPKEAESTLKKMNSSKECKIFRLTSEICQKSHAEASLNAATEQENQITKESGVVNKYARYKIAQYKSMHGVGNLPKLISSYNAISGKTWNKENCSANSTFDSPEEEEISVCGCNQGMSNVSETPCP